MLKKMKFIIYTKPFIAFIYFFIRLYSMTFRFNVVNEQQWQNELKAGKRVLLCAWHQQFFAAIRHFKSYARLNPGLMISQSRDGELIAGVANRTGWHTARGSSSKGGKEALLEMIEHLKCYGFGAQILDGPRGPMGIVKPGVIKMAKESGAIIVPFYISSDKAWFFNSWDKFMLPKPFSKVTLLFGEKISFEPAQTPEQFEQQRQYLEDTMRKRLFLFS
ncbi:MAG: lysophospholipid acyltransferase family protein [Desulfamplus sp.]|nr:lysophospholipid acyltransferase family protein [Desulfamplus sp.]